MNFSIDYALAETGLKEKACALAGKLPYLAAEDVLAACPVTQGRQVWALLEARTAGLTDPRLFARGKLVLLRICNGLLRRLSKARAGEAELGGRVLLYLAAAYPLSERSAVNVTGKANTGNVTTFEEEEEFNKAMAAAAQGATAAAAAANSEGNGEEKTEEKEEVKMDEEEDNATGAPVDYPFYCAFWGIQAFFSDPGRGGRSEELLAELVASAGAVLGAFEGHPFAAEDLAAARDRYEIAAGRTPSKKKKRRASTGGAQDGGGGGGGRRPPLMRSLPPGST